MTPRFLITIVTIACALHMSRWLVRSEGADNFIPNQPAKTGADPNGSDSRAVKYTLLLPTEKSSETVKDAERNPFGKSEDELHDNGGKSSSEETKIQEQLSKLRATGISPGPSGLRVLLGDMWLAKDDVVPAIVKEQTLSLRVNNVTREAIQLVWMEKKFTGLPPRLFVIPVDLRATVRRVPHGQVPDNPESKKESKASKAATAVELPAPIAALTNPAEAGKPSQMALAPMGPPAPGGPATKKSPVADTTMINLSAPRKTTNSQDKNQPAPPTIDASGPQIAGLPAPPLDTPASRSSIEPAASKSEGPQASAASEPSAWKRALGLMNNLVKLSETNKK